jgi:hypothetical protein
MARGITSSSRTTNRILITTSSIARIVAEVAIADRPVETSAEAIEEADTLETMGFRLDQTMHRLARVKRDAIYARRKDAGRIGILRRKEIKLTMTSRRS